MVVLSCLVFGFGCQGEVTTQGGGEASSGEMEVTVNLGETGVFDTATQSEATSGPGEGERF